MTFHLFVMDITIHKRWYPGMVRRLACTDEEAAVCFGWPRWLVALCRAGIERHPDEVPNRHRVC